MKIVLLPSWTTSADMAPYCLPANSGIQQTTLAGLPMAYEVAGEGLFMCGRSCQRLLVTTMDNGPWRRQARHALLDLLQRSRRLLGTTTIPARIRRVTQ